MSSATVYMETVALSRQRGNCSRRRSAVRPSSAQCCTARDASR